jgi:hypothetical protein
VTANQRTKINGFQIFEDRHGKWRCYHRKTRVSVDCQMFLPFTIEFVAECARVAAQAAPTPPEVQRPLLADRIASQS